ncbi:uncharacterized protein LOC128956252 [Oppia nitens]|uniref:uncharacterized protein LOC128956252 n=1 Tax=Oppia nitens TaxID=1686743 RepID=UPI0023DA862B|nr:uncharacterized protein LOC128956252 [Oppia nitens]
MNWIYFSHYFLVIIIITICLYNYYVNSQKAPICLSPTLDTADHMANNSVRLYKGNQYWDLIGLPDRVGFLRSPKQQPIVWENFGKLSHRTHVVSCFTGNRRGYVYKFEGNRLWAWSTSAAQWIGGKDGQQFKLMPTDADPTNGFDIVFHNGLKDNPQLIAMIGNKVYYYSTKQYYITLAEDTEASGHPNGKYGENFPTGVDAAFSWPSDDGNGYLIFFFKKDKYCFRKDKLESGKECDEWRDSRELFGCNN